MLTILLINAIVAWVCLLLGFLIAKNKYGSKTTGSIKDVFWKTSKEVFFAVVDAIKNR
tara:strand:- start:126 stop:299 length:174 start_codon:yes stop_codon:yes gene_type:complete